MRMGEAWYCKVKETQRLDFLVLKRELARSWELGLPDFESDQDGEDEANRPFKCGQG